ncbi:MAG TPA: YihY/virulence factor BrkB family protein, partial [Longimicrobiaceae bacterium]|nr:YihY/virulence factor BrkB family protein [Longimicrobiaceae bacterium]
MREERDPSQGFLKSLWSEIQEDDVFNLAAGIAFFAFLSFPPTFLVVFALAGFFGGPAVADRITMELGALLPEEAESLVQGFVNDVVYREAPGPLSVGLLLALWASSNVFMALARALNTAYDIDDARPWVKQRTLSIGVM